MKAFLLTAMFALTASYTFNADKTLIVRCGDIEYIYPAHVAYDEHEDKCLVESL